MSRLTLVLVLVSMMMVTTTAVADYNLTGLWHADDGGLYYIRHVGDQIWWAGLSTNSTAGYLDFFKGLDFANVFRGTLSGTRISGTWADVPRGAILSHGTLAGSVAKLLFREFWGSVSH